MENSVTLIKRKRESSSLIAVAVNNNVFGNVKLHGFFFVWLMNGYTDSRESEGKRVFAIWFTA